MAFDDNNNETKICLRNNDNKSLYKRLVIISPGLSNRLFERVIYAQSGQMEGNSGSASTSTSLSSVYCPWLSNTATGGTGNKGKMSEEVHCPCPTCHGTSQVNPRSKETPIQQSSSQFFHFLRLMQLFPDVHPATLHTVMSLCHNDFFAAVDKLLYAKKCKELYNRKVQQHRHQPYCCGYNARSQNVNMRCLKNIVNGNPGNGNVSLALGLGGRTMEIGQDTSAKTKSSITGKFFLNAHVEGKTENSAAKTRECAAVECADMDGKEDESGSTVVVRSKPKRDLPNGKNCEEVVRPESDFPSGDDDAVLLLPEDLSTTTCQFS